MGDLNHDIEKYLRGELSSSEMHALEKKALDDPFLADALEGVESVSADDFNQELQQLREAVQKKIDRDNRKVIPFWSLAGRIAAGLLVLIVSAYLVITFLNKNERRDELALNKPGVQPKPAPAESETNIAPTATDKTDIVKHDYDRLHETEKTPDNALQYPHMPTPEKNVVVTQEPGNGERALDQEIVVMNNNAKLDSVMVEKDVTFAAPVVKEKFEAEDRIDSKKIGSTDKYPSSAVRRSALAKAEYKKQPSVIVHGTVTDDNNEPLPGVNVMIKGSNEGVVTDVDGNYQIPLDDINAELVFSCIGMTAVDVPVANKEAIDVKMEEDVSQLSEVVVVGYTSAQDRAGKEEEPNIYQLAEPQGGRKAFKKYLIDNMKYPELAIENKIQGKVTIQFTVQQSGIVNDFKVLRGIGYGCDEEVIRLIRQGPKWTPTRRNAEPLKGKVKVRLKFQLPE